MRAKQFLHFNNNRLFFFFLIFKIIICLSLALFSKIFSLPWCLTFARDILIIVLTTG